MVNIGLTNPDQFPQIPNPFLWYSLFNDQLQNQQPPSQKALTLREFVNDYWLPFEIENGERKPDTVSFYKSTIAPAVEFFGDQPLESISLLDIDRFIRYLKTEGKMEHPMLQSRSVISITPCVKCFPTPKGGSWLQKTQWTKWARPAWQSGQIVSFTTTLFPLYFPGQFVCFSAPG